MVLQALGVLWLARLRPAQVAFGYPELSEIYFDTGGSSISGVRTLKTNLFMN